MEIRARPRQHRGGVLLGRALLGLAVLVGVGLLALAALGLRPHAVADDTMSSAFPRGTLVLSEGALVEQLGLGDVIVVPASGGDAGWVARRVIEIDDGRVLVRGDVGGGGHPTWWDPELGELQLVVSHVPWLGYPWLLADAGGPLLLGGVLGAVLLGALLGVVLVRRHRARGAVAGGATARRSTTRSTTT